MQLSAASTQTRRNRRAVIGALGILVACAGAAACSMSSSPGMSGGGTFGSASGVAAPPRPGPPIQEDYCTSEYGPKNGEACTDAARTCELGSNPDPACNTIARCNGKRWVFTAPNCTTSCPTAYDERAPGDTCGDPLCTYLEATCGCVGAVAAVDSGLLLDDEAGTDAGAEASAPKLGTWQCVRPANDCPSRRPLAGMRCPKAITCDYGACLFGATGLVLDCVDNVWTEAEASCP